MRSGRELEARRPPLATRTDHNGAHDRDDSYQKTERHSALAGAFHP
jgi:hypothetical protein